jgi:uncharacterized membrane-anchored protein
MKIKSIVLAGVLLLQTAWMLGTVAVQEWKLTEGKIVVLETRPVDPRDLLRGDYVILNYAISTIPRDKFQPPLTNDLPQGTAVYVLLEPQGKFYGIAQASTTRLAPNENSVLLRGLSVWAPANGVGPVRVDYGIERYYVREGAGNPRGKLTVEVAVPQSGRAVIKQVYVDGKPYAEVMKEPN